MNHQEQENPGTGLNDVFDILIKAPPQRLQSLTVQLGESPEDNIIHALCLLVLQRNDLALNKLQMLGDNGLAKHLAEKLQIGAGNLEEFRDHCGDLQELTGETLTILAQIFEVLSKQRLCGIELRNLAYQRALSTNGQKTSKQEFDQIRKEAKDVCGPPSSESPKHLKSGYYHDPHRSLDGGNTTLTLSQDRSQRAQSLPSPLQAGSLVPSFPTHLEISLPPTVSFQRDKQILEAPVESKLNSPTLDIREAKNAPEQSQSFVEPQSKSNEPTAFEGKKDLTIDAAFANKSEKLDSRTTQTHTPSQKTKPSTVQTFAVATATDDFPAKIPVSHEMHESQGAEAEEEEIFYAFVILHAPEDEDMADKIKERVEVTVNCKGAIFSDDFAIPGKSHLSCVEDAINNSAFTFLLLTRNFNTRMLDMETNSALINSLNKEHKYNTVIPLLPRKNCLPKQDMPIVLLTLVPLEENRSFEKKIQKAMSPAKIKEQKKIWSEERRVKIHNEKLERLKQIKKQSTQDSKSVQLLLEENLRLQNLLLSRSEQHDGDGQAGGRKHSNIHIENAQYIMIGNDSQMTVDFGGGADKDDSLSIE
ncbi:LOW QUALITY PROTEIN: TIR domain-containing adapter molecule 1 [Anabas testudineus]|uniref:LOW QUALITY PROTEIN: TIR domain-containing adapter molecule 1 n=1 Tax=Anabas testudineus TaxID=64144 RepID=UPI00143D3AA1|nr:LOW QUALITY PROTEIN: TIR domain-containing adapter molecule 1 [Anabas testudineus]